MTTTVETPAGTYSTARNWPWLLASIVALGALLRLRTLGADDLWLDEVLTLYYTQNSLIDLWLRPNDPTPPLYYTLHKIFAGGAVTEAGIRAVSATAGVAAIPVIFLLGRSLGGVAAGIAAAFLLALSGAHIEYSQEARSYALTFLLIVASAAGLAEHLRRVDRGEATAGRPLIVYGVFAVLAVYGHLSAVFWLLASQAALLVDALLRMRLREALRRWFASAQLALPATLPAFGMTIAGSREFRWLDKPSAAEFASTLGEIALVRQNLDWWPWGSALLLAALVPGVAALRRNRPAALVVAAIAAVPLLLWAAGVLKPIFMFRTALPFLIAAVLLWALAAARLSRLWGLVATAAVGAVLAASHIGYERSEQAGHDWSAAAEFVAENAAEGDLVVLCTWKNYPPFRYYAAEDSSAPILGVWTAEQALLFPSPAKDVNPWLASYNPQEAPVVSASQLGERTLWIVDPDCAPTLRETLDQFLAAAGVTTEPRWKGRQVAISVSSP